MSEAATFDGRFYTNFKAVMDAYGLPCPETLFGTAATAVANVTAMAKACATAPGVTMRQFVKMLPRVAHEVGRAKTIVQLGEMAGGVLAATYVGACIGALLLATWDTYGSAAIGKLYALTDEIERTYGQDLFTVLVSIANPKSGLGGAPMMHAQMRARAHTKPGPQKRRR